MRRVTRKALQPGFRIGGQALTKLLNDAGGKMIGTECAHCLQRDACRGPRSQQGPRARVFEVDDLIADLDLPGTAVSQIDDLCGHLRRNATRVYRMCWCRLLETIAEMIKTLTVPST